MHVPYPTRSEGESQQPPGSHSASLPVLLLKGPKDEAPTGTGPRRQTQVHGPDCPERSTFHSHVFNQQGQGQAALGPLLPSLPKQTELKAAAATVQGTPSRATARPQRQHGLPDRTADQPGPHGQLRLCPDRLSAGRSRQTRGPRLPHRGRLSHRMLRSPGTKHKRVRERQHLKTWQSGHGASGRTPPTKATWRPGSAAAGAQPCGHQGPPGPASPSCGLLATLAPPPPASSPISCPAGTEHGLAC